MKKLFLLLTLIVLIGSNVFGHSLLSAFADESGSPETNKYYTSIEIHSGDSLWSIAEQYRENSGMTTTQYIKELKSMNGLGEDIIHSGQYLTIVYYIPEGADLVR